MPFFPPLPLFPLSLSSLSLLILTPLDNMHLLVTLRLIAFAVIVFFSVLEAGLGLYVSLPHPTPRYAEERTSGLLGLTESQYGGYVAANIACCVAAIVNIAFYTLASVPSPSSCDTSAEQRGPTG